MDNKMKYLTFGVVAIVILAAVAAVVLTQNEGDEEITISQKGSDTMLELAQIWAEHYMENETNVIVEVSGGGSGTGISALINGEVDIAQASRGMKSSEIESAMAAGFTPVEFKVAIDGIAIVVNEDNGVSVLTIEQLRGIYNGTITNWDQVGGADQDITLYGRQSSSGTYVYFQEEVLDDENYSIGMNMLTGNSAIVNAVQGDASGIGYVGIGYADASGINIVELKDDAESVAYSPTDQEAVLSGDYALARYLYLYTKGTPTGAIRDYMEWIINPDKGQTIVPEIGFYATPTEIYLENVEKLGLDTGEFLIKQKGSDTMLELCQIWAEEYMDYNDLATIEVYGGGSGTGISALINGQVDIAQASRPMKTSEMDAAIAAGFTPVEFPVAIDGIAIITNDDNTVTELTMEQLRGIYNGTITNWDQVGGADQDITLYGRQSSSGTYVYFQEEVLDDENYSIGMNLMTGNSAIVNAVQSDAGGIGYVGIGYVNDPVGIDILALKADDMSTAYLPTDDAAVLSGSYELSRYLYLYTKGTPTAGIKDYMMWLIDPDQGQSMIADIGFYAISTNVYEDNLVKLGETPGSVILSQKGSDTMLELCQIFAEEFQDDYPWITVEVSGGGSGTGISALINGQVDLAQASRQMKASEYDSAAANGVDPVEFRVAIDGIAVITHEDNPVSILTKEQLKGIYNGTITNWDQVGGADQDITLYGRQSSSGTYVYFQEEVLDDENYSIGMNMLTGNSAIVNAVQGDEGGIGYVGIGYAVDATGINVMSLKETDSDPAYSPLNEESVLSGDYLLARYLYIYTDGTPSDQIGRWLGWILSADGGQSVVSDIGFYALPQAVVEEEMAKLG